MDEQEIWSLGREFVEPGLGRPILARGDLPAAEFSVKNLKFDADGVPHARHSNVINWPSGESEWLKVARDLADAAKLRLPSDPD